MGLNLTFVFVSIHECDQRYVLKWFVEARSMGLYLSHIRLIIESELRMPLLKHLNPRKSVVGAVYTILQQIL